VVRFNVRDTGPGLTQSEQARLFQPFTQIDSGATRKHGGTGLGLAIVARLVHLMGGETGVESSAGQGSTFWFTAPLRRVQPGAPGNVPARFERRTGRSNEVADQQAKMPGRIAMPNPQPQASAILVVEDNAANRAVAREQLAHLGYAAEFAMNGSEAVTRLCRPDHGFRLVLMDCQMPYMDGCTAAAQIRAWEQIHGGHVPIVALTAQALVEDVERSLTVGMDEHIAKPVRLPELQAVVDRFLN
jgi:CheY-like chemotaxis protein